MNNKDSEVRLKNASWTKNGLLSSMLAIASQCQHELEFTALNELSEENQALSTCIVHK